MSIASSGAFDLSAPEIRIALQSLSHVYGPILPSTPAGQDYLGPRHAGVKTQVSILSRVVAHVYRITGPGAAQFWDTTVHEYYEAKCDFEPIANVYLDASVTDPLTRAAVKSALNDYDYGIHGDIENYVRTKALEGIPIEKVNLIWSFALKQTSVVPYNHEEIALKEMLDGKAGGKIHYPRGESSSLENHFDGIKYVRIRSYDVALPFARPRDPGRQLEPESGKPPLTETEVRAAIDNVVEQDNPDCSSLRKEVHKVCDLASVPEFAIRGEMRRIKVGCLEFDIMINSLWQRWKREELWVAAVSESDVREFVFRAILGCALNAALDPEVIVSIFVNFYAALIAFGKNFGKCIMSEASEAKRCVSPGLFTVTDVSRDWTPIW